jgi:hypothetical protein
MVCPRNICVNTLHKGDSIFTYNNNNNNNNNNDMIIVRTIVRMHGPGTKQIVTINKHKMSKEIKPLCCWVTNAKLEIFT